jgi:Holliday junction resolvase RusA-like endonuclease
MTGLRIVAHGTPASQGSKKGFIRGKKVVLVEMDDELPAWRAVVKAAAKLAAGPNFQPIDEPVKVAGEIRIRKPRTTKFQDYPAGPKDLDKMQRAIGDALESAGILTNDARIVHWDIRKVWATNTPGLDITITKEKP